MSIKHVLVGMIVMAGGWVPVLGAPLMVDGDLSDWGVAVADNNGTRFSFTPGIGLLDYYAEDQNDLAGDGGLLGPNYGGQNYDAELMTVAYQQGSLFLAIVTGQRPDNGFVRYAPGDIRIETDQGTYAIEVGGGMGGEPGLMISSGDTGSTYTLKKHGWTEHYEDANPLQTAGSIWADVDWLLDPISPKQPTQFEIDDSSTLVGIADYVFTADSVTTQHAIIELSFDVSLFDGATIESVHWRPSCGNDELDVTVNLVPEPTSLLLLTTGVLATAGGRRR
ncbi:MAG: PEP-CTERM sorting domain-containing protein [Phycisphaerae bacterium]|nr:PEP-CTERM sorting domain-containing protein [Phycisphaerae bacterium]